MATSVVPAMAIALGSVSFSSVGRIGEVSRPLAGADGTAAVGRMSSGASKVMRHRSSNGINYG
jgi:hypothetical protein